MRGGVKEKISKNICRKIQKGCFLQWYFGFIDTSLADKNFGFADFGIINFQELLFVAVQFFILSLREKLKFKC